MVSIPPPTHIAIGGPPPTIWTVGPLDRRTIAGLLAEINLRVKTASLRPELHAAIDGDTARLYLIDRACSMQVLGLVMDLGASTVCELPDAITISGADLVLQWATAPAPGATGAAVDLGIGICRDCTLPIAEAAPGPGGKRLCKPCWRLRVAAGRQAALAADLAFLSRRQAA